MGLKKFLKSLGKTSVWGAIFKIAQINRRSLSKPVMVTVVTSDSAGGLCDHPTQPGSQDLGWGVRGLGLIIHQESNTSNWFVSSDRFSSLAVLGDWEDVHNLDPALADKVWLLLSREWASTRFGYLSPGLHPETMPLHIGKSPSLPDLEEDDYWG